MIIRFIFGCFALCCLSAQAFASSSTVSVKTDPIGVKVFVYKIDKNYEWKKLDHCKTPCELEFELKKPDIYRYYINFAKKGHVSDSDIELIPDQAIEGNFDVYQFLRTAEQVRIDYADRKQAEKIASLKAAKLRRAEDIQECQRKSSSDPSPNRHAMVCKRTTPNINHLIHRSEYSALCEVKFDVAINGMPENIAPNCSNIALNKSVVNSVQKWIYLPAKEDSKLVRTSGIVVRIVYQLTDDNGDPLPFPPENEP